MDNLIPSLADLVAQWIADEKLPGIELTEAMAYDSTSKCTGRYRGAFIMNITDNSVVVRNIFKPILAANPDFFTLLRDGIDKAKTDIDTFEYWGHIPPSPPI